MSTQVNSFLEVLLITAEFLLTSLTQEPFLGSILDEIIHAVVHLIELVVHTLVACELDKGTWKDM